MGEINTPFKRAVHMIIQSIVNEDEKYVLKKQFIRWRRVEKDLWSLEKLTSQQAVAPDTNKTEPCKWCGYPNGYWAGKRTIHCQHD